MTGWTRLPPGRLCVGDHAACFVLCDRRHPVAARSADRRRLYLRPHHWRRLLPAPVPRHAWRCRSIVSAAAAICNSSPERLLRRAGLLWQPQPDLYLGWRAVLRLGGAVLRKPCRCSLCVALRKSCARRRAARLSPSSLAALFEWEIWPTAVCPSTCGLTSRVMVTADRRTGAVGRRLVPSPGAARSAGRRRGHRAMFCAAAPPRHGRPWRRFCCCSVAGWWCRRLGPPLALRRFPARRAAAFASGLGGWQRRQVVSARCAASSRAATAGRNSSSRGPAVR